MLVLTAKCVGKPDFRSDITRVSSAMVEASTAEAGCISYNFYLAPGRPDEFFFFEEWKDQAALDFHFATPHFQKFIAELTPMLVGEPAVRTYDVGEIRDLDKQLH
jgi:quinol monooxygenase YgiN